MTINQKLSQPLNFFCLEIFIFYQRFLILRSIVIDFCDVKCQRDLILYKLLIFFINFQACGWSVWWPQVVKFFLWKTVTLNRLYTFSLLSLISFFTFSLKQMLWKRIPCLGKKCSRTTSFFHTFLNIQNL